MSELVVADIGGTHARFAIARVDTRGAVTLGEPITLATADYEGLEAAWRGFGERLGAPLPDAAAIAVAAPLFGPVARMTNAAWSFDTRGLGERLGLDRCLVLNDFAAVAHAAARADERDLARVCGPEGPLPPSGTITVLGPGTGLGIAYFHRSPGGVHVQATEGAHIDFAPVDALDDAILARLRARFARVSVERVVAGPGIVEIHAALGAAEPRAASAIWGAGEAGKDPLAVAAVERFCATLARIAGDYALAQGAVGVVLSGAIAARLHDRLAAPKFAACFRDKGRYEAMMAGIPVKRLTLAEPGLVGAAAAFASEPRQTDPAPA